MAPLEDGNTGIEDDATGARVNNGRLQIIPADASGNPVSVNSEVSGYSLQSRALLYDATGNAIDSVAGTPRRLATQTLEDRPATAVVSSVAASGTTVTLLAANTARRGAMIVNDSPTQKTLYVKLGTGASSSSYTVRLDDGDYFELPFPVYTGIITGIWATPAAGAALVTELS